MSDTTRSIMIVLVTLGAIVFFVSWNRQQSISTQVALGGANAMPGLPAYMNTAADTSSSVAGVPEEPSCPGSPSTMASSGAKQEGCRCK